MPEACETGHGNGFAAIHSEAHFSDDQFEQLILQKYGKKKLKPNAVPKLFSHRPAVKPRKPPRLRIDPRENRTSVNSAGLPDSCNVSRAESGSSSNEKLSADGGSSELSEARHEPDLTNDVNKAYCAFLLSVIPEFEKTNTFLQSGAPQVHVLLEVLNSLLREILLWFVKPSVIKSSCELTDIDYKSSGNQRDDDDLVIGSQTLQILERLKIADKQQFLTRVRFFVVVSDYIILKFPLKSEILKKAEVARLSSIVTAKFADVRYFNRFPVLLPVSEGQDDD
ncbi:hypothetical protein V5799_008269 [Amblyomma americanum]|uniref:Uncharacterized protein n=1 Tax=Amblyomma americanum TaxID=6943 RepID=A0AAQ4FEJ7_AMBAM